jgi:hypothetical protein
MVAMVLTPNEESLIRFVRRLPPEEASKVLVWAQRLADLGAEFDWSSVRACFRAGLGSD